MKLTEILAEQAEQLYPLKEKAECHVAYLQGANLGLNEGLSIGVNAVMDKLISACNNGKISVDEMKKIIEIFKNLKSATKLFSVLLASKRPLITELADKLRLKYPLLPTISPCPTMRLEAIRSIIPISCRRYPKSV